MSAATQPDIFEQSAKEFGSDALFIHSLVRNIMQQHKLDPQDKNLQQAFIKLAIGVKNRNYPKR